MADDTTRRNAPVNVGLLERQIDDEGIARRAYEIYESRHRADGHAEDDWFQAVAEYDARRTNDRIDPSGSLSDRVRSRRQLTR